MFLQKAFKILKSSIIYMWLNNDVHHPFSSSKNFLFICPPPSKFFFLDHRLQSTAIRPIIHDRENKREKKIRRLQHPIYLGGESPVYRLVRLLLSLAISATSFWIAVVLVKINVLLPSSRSFPSYVAKA
jgi:hypothetical protein